jgi:hypothetical protein
MSTDVSVSDLPSLDFLLGEGQATALDDASAVNNVAVTPAPPSWSRPPSWFDENVSALTAENVRERLKQFNGLSCDSTTQDVVGFVNEFLRESTPLENDQEDTLKQRACIAADLVLSLFHLRAVRCSGRGIKPLFFVAFLELCKKFPSTGNALIRLIPRYGCWKDLLEICCFSEELIVENACLEAFASQLREDERAITDGRALSFAAKWAPTEKKHYDKRKRLVDRICIFLYHPEHSVQAFQSDDKKHLLHGMRKKYRKLLSKLRSTLTASNVKERAQKWSLKVAEKTLPHAQLNLAELHPYTIFRKTIDAYYFDEVRHALHDSQEGIFNFFSRGDVYNGFRAELPSGTLQLIDVARVSLVRETLSSSFVGDLISSFVFGLDKSDNVEVPPAEGAESLVSHVTLQLSRLESMESSLNKLVIFTREGNHTLGVMSYKKRSSDESRRIIAKLCEEFVRGADVSLVKVLMKDCKVKHFLTANSILLRHAANVGKHKIVRYLLRFNPQRDSVLDALTDVLSKKHGRKRGEMEFIAIMLKKYLEKFDTGDNLRFLPLPPI